MTDGGGAADMSERITWETCPVCGASAAVGWAGGPETGADRSARAEPTEFDCLSGCSLSAQELLRVFA